MSQNKKVVSYAFCLPQILVQQDDPDVLLHAAPLRRRHHHRRPHHAARGTLDALRTAPPSQQKLQVGIILFGLLLLG